MRQLDSTGRVVSEGTTLDTLVTFAGGHGVYLLPTAQVSRVHPTRLLHTGTGRVPACGTSS